ncbi:hypothetical protein DFS34DRAFT_598785 [Phlyctochytrium arcticum]|nr:hypothetical protein DFS34DRAFT_598785 [Phlyctochytrium arcticum]
MSSNNPQLEAVRLGYRAALAELTFNSKPIITNLTILAQAHLAQATAVVQAVEDQMRNALPKQKLPVLYLLDSICKNIGAPYNNLFSRNIARLFITAFQAVDQDDQVRFLKVLDTWKPGPLFAPNVIANIEKSVRKPAPRRLSNGQIHVNPNFVSANGRSQIYPPPSSQPVGNNRSADGPIRHPIPRRRGPSGPYDKPPSGRGQGRREDYGDSRSGQRMYQGSQNQNRRNDQNGSGLGRRVQAAPSSEVSKLQHQLQSLLAQKEAFAILNPLDATNQNQIQVLSQLLSAVQTTSLDNSSLLQIGQTLAHLANASQPVLPGAGGLFQPASLPFISSLLPAVSSLAAPLSLPNQQPPLSLAGLVPGVNPQSNLLSNPVALNGLLDSIRWGGLPTSTASATGMPTTMAMTPNMNNSANGSGGMIQTVKDLPRIRLVNEDINKSYPSAPTLLYEALNLQCRQCGTRYFRDEVGRKKMDAHLDWHFRQNRRSREKAKKAVSRDWFVDEEEWVKEREVDIRDRKAPTLFFEADKASDEVQEAVVNIPAQGEANPHCAVCQEPLEKFYDQDQEDWMLRAAVRNDGQVYHQSCFQDKAKAPSPTPSANGKMEVDAGAIPITSSSSVLVK